MTIAILTLAVVSLASCTDDPAPVGTLPNGSPAVSASTPATPEPTRPVEEATPESAIQFTRYFWDLYNYAYQTYDTAALETISDPQCKFCKATIEDVASFRTGAKTIEGWAVRVDTTASPPVKITSAALVIAVITQPPGTATDSSGNQERLQGFRHLRASLALAWTTSGWTVRGVDYDEKTSSPWAG